MLTRQIQDSTKKAQILKIFATIVQEGEDPQTRTHKCLLCYNAIANSLETGRSSKGRLPLVAFLVWMVICNSLKALDVNKVLILHQIIISI